MDYQVLKAVHIIFVVSWFAALLYIVRLFIYHVEAESKDDTAKAILQDQFKIMQKRLWYIIGWPAMIIATTFGIWMIVERPTLMERPFMHVKFGLLVGLFVYHFMCERILRQLAKGKIKWKSFQLRLWNELATMLLVAIVFVVVMKNTLDWLNGLLGFLILGVVLMLLTKLYKRIRNKRGA